jgi:hypothetical protein
MQPMHRLKQTTQRLIRSPQAAILLELRAHSTRGTHSPEGTSGQKDKPEKISLPLTPLMISIQPN